MMPPPLLSVEVSRKAFGGHVALAGLRFAVAAGEILAITGPSGCGKSTLLRIIAGLDRDFAGAVSWHGSARLGMAFQEPRLLPWRSVRENLRLAGAPDAEAARLLGALGLAGSIDALAARLSLGMARRVALARALAIAPDVLLLDEPFASLDAAAAAAARMLLRETLAARRCAALLVTHDMSDAAALADRVLLLSAGPARLLADVPVPAAVRAGGGDATGFAAGLADYFKVAR